MFNRTTTKTLLIIFEQRTIVACCHYSHQQVRKKLEILGLGYRPLTVSLLTTKNVLVNNDYCDTYHPNNIEISSHCQLSEKELTY